MTGPRLEERSFRAVGTHCRIAATAGPRDGRLAARALGAGIAEVAACEAVLSRFDAASDLSRLNARAGRWTDVDTRLVEALELAVQARDATGGRFDPTILPALVAAGYDRTFEELDERQPRKPHGWRAGAAVEVDTRRARVRVAAGSAVDLGGIGKGYAAARALRAMHDAWPGMPGALVDLGGDLAIDGSPPGGGLWRIDVTDPRTPRTTAARLLIGRGGVATSGRDARRFGPGRSLHHLIDPATGEPAEPGPLAVTVVAPDPAEAEAHATALAISSLSEAAEHLGSQPQIAALYIAAEGKPVALGPLPLAPPRLLVRAA